jgi:hypothetical protein
MGGRQFHRHKTFIMQMLQQLLYGMMMGKMQLLLQ